MTGMERWVRQMYAKLCKQITELRCMIMEISAGNNVVTHNEETNTISIGAGDTNNVTVVIEGPVQLRGDLVYIKNNEIEHLPEGQMWVDENGHVHVKVTADTNFVVPPDPTP